MRGWSALTTEKLWRAQTRRSVRNDALDLPDFHKDVLIGCCSSRTLSALRVSLDENASQHRWCLCHNSVGPYCMRTKATAFQSRCWEKQVRCGRLVFRRQKSEIRSKSDQSLWARFGIAPRIHPLPIMEICPIRSSATYLCSSFMSLLLSCTHACK